MPPILTQLPEDIMRQETVSVIKKYLCEETYIPLSFCHHATVTEHFSSQTTSIEGQLCLGGHGYQRIVPLSGHGKGPADALFNGFRRRFADEYSFLDVLHLREFKIDTLPAPHPYSRNDAPVMATIIVQVDERSTISFRRDARSLIDASLRTTLSMFEYFINARTTMSLLHKLVRDYKSRGRADLYDQALGDLVNLNRCAYYKQ
jgi:hypothetical protein